MKWYDKIGVVKWCLIAFLLFIFLSLVTIKRDWVWWPEFFLIMAEAALSVIVVLEIIEVSSRRERERQWARVKTIVYSQILDKLRMIGYHVCSTTFMVMLESQDLDREKIERHGLDREEAAFVLRSLAVTIREYYKFLYDLNKPNNSTLKDKYDPMGMYVESLIECFENIGHEINEYRTTLVPRVLALSDDVIVNLMLLKFEEVYTIIFYRDDFLKRYNPSFLWDKDNDQKYIALGGNFVDPAFESLADLLGDAADLYELIQRKSVAEPEKGLIEESLERIKQWLPL